MQTQARPKTTGIYIEVKTESLNGVRFRPLKKLDTVKGEYTTAAEATGWQGRPVSDAQRKLYNGILRRRFLFLAHGCEPRNQGQAAELIEALKNPTYKKES